VDVATTWSHANGDPALPTVVLVHGSMDRSAGLLRLSRRLTATHHVVRYDRRGYGKSLRIGPPYRVVDHLDDLAAVIERDVVECAATGSGTTGSAGIGSAGIGSGGGPVSLFGHSFGGNVALALADLRPDLVSAVAVYESPMSWLDWWPRSSPGGEALATSSPADAAEAFMRAVIGTERWERVPQRVRDARRAEGRAMVAELEDLRARPPWRADRIAVPVLAMHGEEARPFHRRAMEALAGSVAHGWLVEIPGAGHTGPNTHADAIAGAFLSFLSEHHAG
jgi:pimeloyl-ACP methyl ester carboxylesterase